LVEEFDALVSDWMDPEVLITEIMDISGGVINKSLISGVIGIGLGLVPLLFALKIANSMKSIFNYAKNNSGIAQQSYDVQFIPKSQPERSDSTIKYCQYCGNKNQIDSQFCKHCGQKLSY